MRGEALQSLAVDKRRRDRRPLFCAQGRRWPARQRQDDQALSPDRRPARLYRGDRERRGCRPLPDCQPYDARRRSVARLHTHRGLRAWRSGSSPRIKDRIMHRDQRAAASLERGLDCPGCAHDLPDVAIDARRFRPNMVMASESDRPRRAAMAGPRDRDRRSSLVIKAMRPTVRCVMTTPPQAELGAAPAVLRTLADDNAASLRIYAEVLCPGTRPIGSATNCASPRARRCRSGREQAEDEGFR